MDMATQAADAARKLAGARSSGRIDGGVGAGTAVGRGSAMNESTVGAAPAGKPNLPIDLQSLRTPMATSSKIGLRASMHEETGPQSGGDAGFLPMGAQRHGPSGVPPVEATLPGGSATPINEEGQEAAANEVVEFARYRSRIDGVPNSLNENELHGTDGARGEVRSIDEARSARTRSSAMATNRIDGRGFAGTVDESEVALQSMTALPEAVLPGWTPGSRVKVNGREGLVVENTGAVASVFLDNRQLVSVPLAEMKQTSVGSTASRPAVNESAQTVKISRLDGARVKTNEGFEGTVLEAVGPHVRVALDNGELVEAAPSSLLVEGDQINELVCSNCSTSVNESHRFCGGCGSHLE